MNNNNLQPIYTSQFVNPNSNKDNTDNNQSDKSDKFLYVCKFKTALYGFIFFIILSNKVAYKILDIVFKLFTNRNDIIDINDNPLPFGIFINALILALILFIL